MKNLGSLALACACAFFSIASSAQDEQNSNRACESFLVNPHIDEAKLRAAEAGAQKLRAYSEAINSRLLERDQLLQLVEAALLAEEHILLVGPPGNAKSLVADQFLKGIKLKDAQGQLKSSYWKIQLTPETTQSEILGPLSPNQLFNNDVFRRLHSEGILAARLAFIDEIFDGNPKTMRDILGILNERAHAQGQEIHEGILEMVIAASNKYPSMVYERAMRLGDPEGPRAVFDRIALNYYVPKEFEDLSSDRDLIQGNYANSQIPELTFDDIEAVRAIVNDVEIPNHVADFLSLLADQLGAKLEAIEEKATEEYLKAQREGTLQPNPPYRSTKFHSKRTLGKASKFLKAFVVQDWISSGFTRPLKVSLEDIRHLEKFYTLNGPDDQFVDQFLARASNRFERAQLMTIKVERHEFRSIYAEIYNDVNQVLYNMALADIQENIESLQDDEQKRRYAERLLTKLVDTFEHTLGETRPWDNSGQRIGHVMMTEFLESSLKQILGKDLYEQEIAKTIQDKKNELERAIEEEKTKEERARQAEQARIREEKNAQAKAKALALVFENSADERLLASVQPNSLTSSSGFSFHDSFMELSSDNNRAYIVFDSNLFVVDLQANFVKMIPERDLGISLSHCRLHSLEDGNLFIVSTQGGGLVGFRVNPLDLNTPRAEVKLSQNNISRHAVAISRANNEIYVYDPRAGYPEVARFELNSLAPKGRVVLLNGALSDDLGGLNPMRLWAFDTDQGVKLRLQNLSDDAVHDLDIDSLSATQHKNLGEKFNELKAGSTVDPALAEVGSLSDKKAEIYDPKTGELYSLHKFYPSSMSNPNPPTNKILLVKRNILNPSKIQATVLKSDDINLSDAEPYMFFGPGGRLLISLWGSNYQFLYGIEPNNQLVKLATMPDGFRRPLYKIIGDKLITYLIKIQSGMVEAKLRLENAPDLRSIQIEK